MRRRVIIDENLPDKIVDLLEICFEGMDVTPLKKHHGPGTKDIDWMKDLADWRPKPIVLTCDRRILSRELERKALQESGLTFVVFKPTWMDIRFPEKAWRLVKLWPEIQSDLDDRNDSHTILEVEILRGTISHLV